MHRKIIYSVAVFFLALAANGQQVQQFTQYQWLGNSFNPAFAGSDQYFNAVAVHRSQWAGINDAPRTSLLAIDAPSKSKKMGFGGTFFSDVVGPTRRFSVQGQYAYHLQLTEKSKLAMGVSFGITQFSIDGTQITTREAGDQALTSTMQSETKPDASAGLLYYADKYYVGVSAAQILNNSLDLFPGDGDGKMNLHYYFTGGYKFNVSETIDIEPSILVKYVDPIPAQIDLSARVAYKRNLWIGGTYRTNDAAAVFAGYQLLNYLSLGYSYDITTSDIKNYSQGTHEILLKFRFERKQLLESEN